MCHLLLVSQSDIFIHTEIHTFTVHREWLLITLVTVFVIMLTIKQADMNISTLGNLTRGAVHICSLTQLLGGFLLIGTNSQKGLTAWDVPLLYDSLDQAACLHTLTSLLRTLPIFNIRTVSVKCYALGLRTCWLQYDSLSFDTLNTAKK